MNATTRVLLTALLCAATTRDRAALVRLGSALVVGVAVAVALSFNTLQAKILG